MIPHKIPHFVIRCRGLVPDFPQFPRLRWPFRKQPNVSVKLRRFALKLDDARAPDPTTLRLAVP